MELDDKTELDEAAIELDDVNELDEAIELDDFTLEELDLMMGFSGLWLFLPSPLTQRIDA